MLFKTPYIPLMWSEKAYIVPRYTPLQWCNHWTGVTWSVSMRTMPGVAAKSGFYGNRASTGLFSASLLWPVPSLHWEVQREIKQIKQQSGPSKTKRNNALHNERAIVIDIYKTIQLRFTIKKNRLSRIRNTKNNSNIYSIHETISSIKRIRNPKPNHYIHLPHRSNILA